MVPWKQKVPPSRQLRIRPHLKTHLHEKVAFQNFEEIAKEVAKPDHDSMTTPTSTIQLLL